MLPISLAELAYNILNNISCFPNFPCVCNYENWANIWKHRQFLEPGDLYQQSLLVALTITLSCLDNHSQLFQTLLCIISQITQRVPWIYCTVCAAEAASVSFSSSLICCSEITAQGTNYSAWPHLQFLPKISLWVEFHQAILEHGQISILLSPLTKDSTWNGNNCQEEPWQHPHSSDPEVSFFLFNCFVAHSLTGLQIKLHALLPLTGRDC